MTLEQTYLKAKHLIDTGKISQDIFRDLMDTEIVAVVHAHWLKDDNNQCYCSACMDDHHRPMFFTPHPQWKYCPWCGAKMGEEVEDA